MKLASREAAAYFRNPDPAKAGLLIYGTDAMRVSLRRQEVVAALIGPDGAGEMRLERIEAGALRRDPALLLDGIRAQGFFPGPRVMLVDGANDAVADPIVTALAEWRPGDAQIVATAGALKAASAIRKAFENHPEAYALGIYDDPPTREEIEATLARAGLGTVDRDAMADLSALAQALDPGDFAQTVERMALFKLGDDTPLSSAEVARLAPTSIEAGVDEVLNAVAEAKAGEIGPVVARLRAQGVGAVTLCIGATRHFRALHTAASDPGGPAAGLARVRPPVFGPRRNRMQRQAQTWGVTNLETALSLLIDTDLVLRSSAPAPDMAVMERTLVRLAMLGGR